MKSGTGNYQAGALDLGVPASGNLTAIRERSYRVDDRWGASPITEADMCQRGGTFHYWNSGWRHVNVPKGMLVSATALSSFVGHIHTTEV
jgi:hypothetical protein